jgi:hypothetical protein
VSYRRQTSKPTAALWLLVAAADIALVLASVGVLALAALVSLAVVAVASVGTWRYLRREGAGSDVAAPAAVRVPFGRS